MALVDLKGAVVFFQILYATTIILRHQIAQFKQLNEQNTFSL